MQKDPNLPFRRRAVPHLRLPLVVRAHSPYHLIARDQSLKHASLAIRPIHNQSEVPPHFELRRGEIDQRVPANRSDNLLSRIGRQQDVLWILFVEHEDGRRVAHQTGSALQERAVTNRDPSAPRFHFDPALRREDSTELDVIRFAESDVAGGGPRVHRRDFDRDWRGRQSGQRIHQGARDTLRVMKSNPANSLARAQGRVRRHNVRLFR